MDICLVYITASTVHEAETIGRTLVLEQLAACANIVPGMRSIYQWQGRLEETQEAILLLKTRKKLFKRLKKRVLALHSYTVPAILELPIAAAHKPYLEWVLAQTAPLSTVAPSPETEDETPDEALSQE